MQLFSALAFLFLAASAYLVGEVVTQPGRERDRAVRRAANYGRHRVQATGLERLRFHERVLVPSVAWLARAALKMNPRANLDAIALRLVSAGMGRSISPTTFLAIKAGSASAAVSSASSSGRRSPGRSPASRSPSASASAAS